MAQTSRLLLLFMLLAVCSLATAQISLPGSGSDSGQEQVQADEVIETATRSFRAHVESELQQITRRNPDLETEALNAAAARILEEFRDRADQEILQLKDDGLLQAGEASNQLEGLRDSFATELDAAISAISVGF